MDNQKDPVLNHEDELKAENNLLKLKLTLEHGVCSLRFVREDDYWNICDFDIPGFSRKD